MINLCNLIPLFQYIFHCSVAYLMIILKLRKKQILTIWHLILLWVKNKHFSVQSSSERWQTASRIEIAYMEVGRGGRNAFLRGCMLSKIFAWEWMKNLMTWQETWSWDLYGLYASNFMFCLGCCLCVGFLFNRNRNHLKTTWGKQKNGLERKKRRGGSSK